jgi:hypothetical protein
MTNITITALGVTTTFNKAPITQLGRAWLPDMIDL